MIMNYSNPQQYIGSFINSYAAYTNNENIRKDAASGGIVSTLLIYLLNKGYVDGVFISRQYVRDGKIQSESFITSSEEDILDSRTSIYTFFGLEKSYKKILDFNGNIAIVLLPCHIKALNKLSLRYPQLIEKVKYKITLFCGGVADDTLIYKILEKNDINKDMVDRIYYRKGHWRGKTFIKMNNGVEKAISYTKNWSTYKNAFFYSTKKCFSCTDHFGYDADFSCGDIWLNEMKKKGVKHTAIITKNNDADSIFCNMINEKIITAVPTTGDYIIKGNKRAVIYKFHTAEARKRLGNIFGFKYIGKISYKSKWNHYLAAFFILLNMRLSKNKKIMKLIFKIPKNVMYYYMVFIRLFISF